MSYDEFIQSPPGKSAGIFFGDTDRYMKAMDWLYKTFEGWPGDFSINLEYDAIKILIASSMFSACSGKSGRHEVLDLTSFGGLFAMVMMPSLASGWKSRPGIR